MKGASDGRARRILQGIAKRCVSKEPPCLESALRALLRVSAERGLRA